MIGIKKYLKNKQNIFDIGTGPNGSHWWSLIDQKAKITGIDLYFFPKHFPKNVNIYKLDASCLHEIKPKDKIEKYINLPFKKFFKRIVNWDKKFDMVVANHVLEHVTNPENLIKGITSIIKPNGIVYAAFPESTNFTDIFYHLIHPEGGGHIQKLTKDSIVKLFSQNGFELLSCSPIEDDWLWFENLFDFKGRGIQYIEKEEISYLANVFRKELTLKRGYFYGWELVLKKNK